MTLSNSPAAYDDCMQAFDAALSDPKGIAIRMRDHSAATHFRMRCHQARALERKANALTYEAGHPMHNVSEYDKLQLRIAEVDGNCWLIFEKFDMIPGEVVSLSGSPPILEALPARRLELPKPREPEPQLDLGDAFDKIETVEERPKPTGIRRI
jgi:hypothetical protein